jgi:hypothetical protein
MELQSRPLIERTWPIEDEEKAARQIQIGLNNPKVVEAEMYFFLELTGKYFCCAVGMAIVGNHEDIKEAEEKYRTKSKERAKAYAYRDVTSILDLDECENRLDNDLSELSGLHSDLLANISGIHRASPSQHGINAGEIVSHLQNGTFLDEINRRRNQQQ